MKQVLKNRAQKYAADYWCLEANYPVFKEQQDIKPMHAKRKAIPSVVVAQNEMMKNRNYKS